MAFVYILLCENGSYYTGYSTDVERRFKQHLAGKVKYTRAFKPIRILCTWEFSTKSDAMKYEYFIKKQPRKTKERLISEKLQSDLKK